MATTNEQSFIEEFKAFGTTDVKRNLLSHWVETENNKYEILGYKVEDASVEFNWNEEKVTDITGVTYSSITKSEPEMSLEGYIIREGSAFIDKLAKLAIRNAYNEFSGFTIVTVYGWLTKTSGGTEYLAKKETGCTIKPDSIGGQDYARITPTISFSNNAVYGIATITNGVLTFTQQQPAPAQTT